MQIVRLILWVFFGALGIILLTLNWGEPQPVRIMPGAGGDSRLFEWPIGFIGLVFFLLGFVPMWIIHHVQKWRWKRRVKSLESATTRMATATTMTDKPDPAPAAPTSPPRADGPTFSDNPIDPEPTKPA